MSNVEIEKAMIKFLEENQPFSPSLVVVGPLQAYTPAEQETYLRTSFFPNMTNTLSSAKGGPVQFTGIFQILVVGPATGSSFELKEIAGVIADQLFAQHTVVLTETGKKIKVPGQSWVSGLLSDPVSPAVPVSVPYSAARIA